MNKLHRRNHTSVTSARRELAGHGYWTEFVPPGHPEKWTKKGHPPLAIGREDRERSQRWHIVEYPA